MLITCTDPVRIKIPVESTYNKPLKGGFVICGREESASFRQDLKRVNTSHAAKRVRYGRRGRVAQ